MVEEMGQTQRSNMGPESAKHTPEEIEAIGQKYFGPWTLRAIQTAHTISDHELRRIRDEQGWPLRKRRVAPQSLVKRLILLVDEQVSKLEKLQERSGEDGFDEKQSDVLARTAATLQRLIAMDTERKREAKPKPGPKGLTETQVRLAQRLEELRRR